MKSKFSYKSKRTIIIAAIITVLLAGTATGVYFFTKGNAQAQAAGDNNRTQEQYGEAPEENKNEQQNNTTENEQNKNEQGETTPNQQEEQETERQEQTTNNNQTTQNEQTTTTTTGEVPNQEYVTEREETVKNPWETLEVGWGPTQFASIASTANLTAKKSNLEIHKTVDKESVKIGDTLTYTISVKNNGDKVAKAIIYDNVPEGTVLLNKDNNEDENTKKLTWRVTVEPGETENVEFTVRVKAEKGTIKNSAIVNGKTTEETETGIINITGKKEVDKAEAKVGDTLTYTITLTNSGNATGTVTVTDEIPAGTTLVEKSITNNGVESNGTITWTDVEVKAGKTAEVSFKVTINSDTKTSVTNKAVIDGNKPTEEVETKVANITTTKTSVGIRNGSQLEAGATLHEFDVIKYTLTATNTGNGNGSVVLEDTVPEGTTLVASSIKVDGKGKYTEADLNSGITVEVAANSTVTLTFQVKVNKLTTAEVHIKNENAKQDDTPINPTDDKVKKEYVTVTANKEWVDFDGVDGMRPESVEFELVADGTPTNNKQTASKDNWTVEFSNLDKYTESGNIIEYTIQENNVNEYYTPSYEVSKNGDITTVKVTNTLIYEKIKISVEATKTWVDKDNKVGVRPENIKFALYADGVATGKTETLSGTESTWTTTFENLDKYKSNGETIVYTVKEAETPVHYTKSEDGLTVTNTIDYTTFTKAVTVNKVWQKPASVSKVPDITINLYQNNNTLFSTQTLKNGATSAEFTNLPKYDENGDEYTYTAQEGEVTEYNTSYSEDKLTITNKIKQDTSVRVSVIKTWVTPDVNNVPEITINLLKNGTEIAEKILKAGTTTYTFENLEKYMVNSNGDYVLDDNGNVTENVYTVTEDAVEGYTSVQNGTNFTNTINQEKLSVSGNKTWVTPDASKVPDITINLLRDGTEIAEKTLKAGTTAYEFTDLDKYAPDGHIYTYTVTEDAVEGYASVQNGTNFTNTINQEKLSVSGNKTWVTPDASKVPDITINLLRDGTEIAEKTLKAGTTAYEFTDLDKYAPDGHIYTYTVTEDAVEGYTSVQNGTNFTNTINQEKLSVSGNKTWVTPDASKVPDITINLLRDGTEIAEKTLKAGTTAYEFTDLDKYAPDGHIYTYTVTEDAVEGYTSVQNGTNFTNTINQEKLSVSGNKTWVTPDASKVPDITINLLRDGTEIAEKTLKAGTTAYEFTDLDKYAPDGHIYTYTVTEDAVEGYASVQNGTNFTNTVKQEKLSVSGTKTWVGTPAGVATPDITINLFKDGVKESEVVLESGNTTYSFENLDKYDLTTGKEYKYTITENKVQNYETSYKGYNITNTFKQEITGEIKVTKTSTSTTKISNPLDVVFVLDVSGSMRDNSKYANMVDAVNSAISTIMNKNADSRVGIVTFSGDSTNLLELGSYTPNEKDKYLKASKYKISTNVSNYNKKSVNVTGGTYTQSGIKAGADLLTNASTTYTTTINGKETTLTRTPVLILLSDGLPTYYTNSYEGQLGRRNGDGSDTNLEESYYTIRTADYYKKQITNHYYAGTSNESKFYTIGFDLEGTLEETILNPTEANVNKCDAEGNGRYGNRNVRGELYDRIIKDGKSAGAYSYADGSYTGKMSTADLENIFNQIINQTSTSTETRSITVEESNARKVELTNIDTNKAFSLTINSTTYSTFARAVDAGYVKGDETSGYYVDLSTVAEGSIVSIEYNEK